MVLSNRKITIIFIQFFIIIGCEKKQTYSQCGEVSVRLMLSIVDSRFESIIRSMGTSDNNAKELIDIISHLRNFNNELVLLAGGYKKGKNLEVVNPCVRGEQVAGLIKKYQLEETYNDLVNTFVSNKMISDKKASNLKFVISSYFCSDDCAFSESNLYNSPAGFLLLENLSLQFALIETF